MTPEELQRHDQFMRLYVKHEESLRAFVRTLVPTLDDAREVMQEVAAVLWRKFDLISSPDDFRRWAMGVARFESLEYRRMRARDRHIFSEETLSMIAAEAEELAESYETQRGVLEECLQKLPEPQRMLLRAAYAPGARIDELAEQMGRTAMSLYKALHRIRQILLACTERSLAEGSQP